MASPLGGEVGLSAILEGTVGALDLNGVSVQLDNDFGRFGFNGHVASLGPDAELELDIDAAVPDLARLESVFDWPLDQYSGVGLLGRAKLLREESQLRTRPRSQRPLRSHVRSLNYFARSQQNFPNKESPTLFETWH